jgi:enoyl-CoA hydratase
LAQLVGKGKAFEMITTAAMMTADEAKQYGLVNYVCPQPELLAKCQELAAKMLKNSPMAIASAIRAINAGFAAGVNGYEVEVEEFGKCFGTPEFIEGTTAFMEKRKANF